MNVMKVDVEKITQPDKIALPQMLDFYPLEDEKNTRISQFFQNLKMGHLTTTKCKSCGSVLWPPRVVCSNCMSDDLEWVNLGTEGELYAFTEMKAGAPLGFEKELPFCIGLVKIGGLLLSSRIDGAQYKDLKIGQKVQLKVVELENDGRVFYRFKV
jgi:uncharacterized OB-fold protein